LINSFDFYNRYSINLYNFIELSIIEKIDFLTISNNKMGFTCDRVLYEWNPDDNDMEIAPVVVAYMPMLFKQKISILSVIIAIMIAWIADGVIFAQTFMMFYGIIGLVVLEQNFHAQLLGSEFATYCSDFGSLMIFGLVAQIFQLQYLWCVAGFLLLFKHRLVILRELSKTFSMNLRDWFLFGFILMPVIITITSLLPN
jgi:hypothetical protein